MLVRGIAGGSGFAEWWISSRRCDSGTQPPERCLFGIMLNISSFLGMATMYVRYKQVQVLMMREKHRVHCLNALGLALGFGSCLGMCVVANFQKSTLLFMHLLGAAMTFGLGMLYVLVESAVSYHMQPHVHSKRVFLVRLAMGLWSLASIIIMIVSSAISYSSLPAVDVILKSHWVPGMPAYTAHLVSTIAEWSVAFSFVTFFLTYIRDFQKITLRAEAELRSNHLYDSTRYNESSRLHHREESPLLAGNI
ncbi:DNA damage-regulated autophagy modulator protein 2-like isoform X2 [Paramormyrops kingsleyae]|uniref:DNA damage-regulated autophagy modulator protein 2-like isoform X2 n=1 Tax=Paramormyrops kingsleyae TaxID=1676925 RepID=UPI000CD64305|nr:DNA damage-regulated autophagy modulator protein 2-like isoform X2 [Paramormyrops kingsleyae]